MTTLRHSPARDAAAFRRAFAAAISQVTGSAAAADATDFATASHEHSPADIDYDAVDAAEEAETTDVILVWRAGAPLRVTVQQVLDLLTP